MNIILLTHPSFLGSQSMPRYAKMLEKGMKERGHRVETWTASPRCFKLPVPASAKKWMGYVDQYLLFPLEFRRRLKGCPADTLFVLTDHALGPWVPLIKNRPHVIHCHDFLAQRSALGEIPENRTGFTGRSYQSFIRKGYQKGRNFISVSKKTQQDLHDFLKTEPQLSEVVYNGLNQNFTLHERQEARRLLSERIGKALNQGFILHVGGNQWYKNREGVVQIYNAWREQDEVSKKPLLLIGVAPNAKLRQSIAQSPYQDDIHVLTGLEDHFIPIAYAAAAIFLFPSLAEGFGWPIAEAMASGVPVITTEEAPMTEVGGDAAFFIPKKPSQEREMKLWAAGAAKLIDQIINFSEAELKAVVDCGFLNSKRFETELSLNKIEEIYEIILKKDNFLLEL